MHRLLHAVRKTLLLPKGYRARFVGYLMLGLIPFLVLTLGINLHFVRQRIEDSVQIAWGLSRQACSQLDSLYDMAGTLATNACVHPNLRNEVLSSYNAENSSLVLNRNFLKIQELIDTYLFIEDFMDIRLYLPDVLAVPNGSFLLDLNAISQEPWYAEYQEMGNIRRWYLAERVQGSGQADVLCAVRPIQNPMDYSSVIGYLRVDISLERIQAILDFSSVMDGTSCFLVDREQGVIWHSGPMSSEQFAELSEVPAESKHSAASARIGSQKYLIAEQPISSSTMSLIYLVPQASITRDILVNCTWQIALLLLEILLLTGLVAIFSSSLLSSRNNRLRLLNEQINPHFLYNTLDMINWQAISRNLPEIYRPIQSLSRFYKISLNHGSDFIRVCDEVEHIRLYLELQNIRFKNGIAYQIEVDPSLRECYILHMVLQPIVENSVVHGIREKDSMAGNLHIAIAKARGQLQIAITDDGVGIDGPTARQLLREGSSAGYGLSNIQQRIQLYYGKRYGLTIESTPQVGTTVYIHMPIVLKEPETREL